MFDYLRPIDWLLGIGGSVLLTAIGAVCLVLFGAFLVWLQERTRWDLITTEESIAYWKKQPYINLWGEKTDKWGNRLVAE